MLGHLASANPVSLCDPMAFGKGRQPNREGHERGAVYNERRGRHRGLGWKAPDAWLW
uniref:Integrase n=1 Tax=Mesocestoides corti TaxID=53468 RepID=A0A5K3EI73_MESCO